MVTPKSRRRVVLVSLLLMIALLTTVAVTHEPSPDERVEIPFELTVDEATRLAAAMAAKGIDGSYSTTAKRLSLANEHFPAAFAALIETGLWDNHDPEILKAALVRWLHPYSQKTLIDTLLPSIKRALYYIEYTCDIALVKKWCNSLVHRVYSWGAEREERRRRLNPTVHEAAERLAFYCLISSHDRSRVHRLLGRSVAVKMICQNLSTVEKARVELSEKRIQSGCLISTGMDMIKLVVHQVDEKADSADVRPALESLLRLVFDQGGTILVSYDWQEEQFGAYRLVDERGKLIRW